MYFLAGAEVGLREEQINAYKNLAVEQVQSLRRLKRDWPFMRVSYHQQFHAFRSKYHQRRRNKNLNLE